MRLANRVPDTCDIKVMRYSGLLRYLPSATKSLG
jgi:hypothetical protein